MDINRLEYFCTVVRTGSLKEAADLLRLSPAALSKAMRILEEEIGAKLFLPAGRGIAITDHGREIAARAEKLIVEVHALRNRKGVKSESAEHPVLRLGSFEVFTTHFIGPLIEKEFSGTPLQLHELTPGKLEDAISAGTVDLGLTYLPIPRSNIEFLKITEIEMGVFGLKGRFKGRTSSGKTGASLAGISLADLPFAVPMTPIEGSPTRADGLDGWPDHLSPRKIMFEVTMMESALELCRRGLAVAYLPTFVARLQNETVNAKSQLELLPVKPKGPTLPQAVYLVKRKTDVEGTSAKKLARAVREICRG